MEKIFRFSRQSMDLSLQSSVYPRRSSTGILRTHPFHYQSAMTDMNQTQQCQNSSFFPDFASTKSFIYIPNLYYSFWYAKFKQISSCKFHPYIPNCIIEKWYVFLTKISHSGKKKYIPN